MLRLASAIATTSIAVGMAVLMIVGAVEFFEVAWPAPPPGIRVYVKGAGCVPCWTLDITPNETTGTAVLCAFRAKDGGFNYTGWKLRDVETIWAGRAKEEHQEACPARWKWQEAQPS